MSKLKPCPSCESEDLIHAHHGQEVKRCKCNSCGLTGPRCDAGGKKWNSLPRRDEWVSVVGDPPKVEEDILIIDKDHKGRARVSEGYYKGNGIWWDYKANKNTGPVTHWQPLPKYPEAKP